MLFLIPALSQPWTRRRGEGACHWLPAEVKQAVLQRLVSAPCHPTWNRKTNPQVSGSHQSPRRQIPRARASARSPPSSGLPAAFPFLSDSPAAALQSLGRSRPFLGLSGKPDGEFLLTYPVAIAMSQTTATGLITCLLGLAPKSLRRKKSGQKKKSQCPSFPSFPCGVGGGCGRRSLFTTFLWL